MMSIWRSTTYNNHATNLFGDKSIELQYSNIHQLNQIFNNMNHTDKSNDNKTKSELLNDNLNHYHFVIINNINSNLYL